MDRSDILKLNEKRISTISNSYGVYDAYKYIRKNKWFNIGMPITESLFYCIIRTINKSLVDDFLKGKDIVFPYKMGKLEVRKYAPKIEIVNNKIKSNLPIDWNRTLKLWEEDEEAYLKKLLVKMEEKEIFKIRYNKSKAVYPYKSFYQFRVNKLLKVKLKELIKNNNFDAFTV